MSVQINALSHVLSYTMMTSWNGNIFRVTGHLCGEFTGRRWIPAQRPVTRCFDVFFDLLLNKRLGNQSWGWWFETPSCPLPRHCNPKCDSESESARTTLREIDSGWISAIKYSGDYNDKVLAVSICQYNLGNSLQLGSYGENQRAPYGDQSTRSDGHLVMLHSLFKRVHLGIKDKTCYVQGINLI